jgi:hypothetical protein
MSPFSCFHIEIADSFLLSDCRVLRIWEWTWSSITESCKIILVPTEILRNGSMLRALYFILKEQCLFLMTFQTTSSIIIFQQLQYNSLRIGYES